MNSEVDNSSRLDKRAAGLFRWMRHVIGNEPPKTTAMGRQMARRAAFSENNHKALAKNTPPRPTSADIWLELTEFESLSWSEEYSDFQNALLFAPYATAQ